MPSNIQADCSPMQQRALPSAIDDLQRAVTNLEGTFYSLQSQLYPVLDSAGAADGCGSEPKAASEPYQHSEQIGRLVSRIRELNSLGADLISRLHV